MTDRSGFHGFCYIKSIVKFIDQSGQGRYFMPKFEENSVNYTKLIGSDFKNVAFSGNGSRHHFPYSISIAVTFIAVIVVSVVLAHSSQSTLDEANLSNTNEVALTIKPISSEMVIASVDATTGPLLTKKENVAEELEPVAVEDVIVDEILTTIVVKKGDTLASIFKNLNIHKELTRLLNLGKEAKPFKKIYPGQKLHFTLVNNEIEKLELEKSITKSLVLLRDGETFTIEETNRELDKITQIATGKINNSLFLAGQNAGLSDSLIMKLAGIFGWDIDFALDIRQGDSFSVLHEELYLEGEKVDDGNIIAAEFINNNATYRAYRYTDSSNNTEYYSPDGKSMRKPFMRTPADIARISSYFNLRRKHPILNKIRAHKGVDYAAARGTPIKATGNGKVVHRGNKGGYGKSIVLRHGNTYTTLYAHMSKYARGTGAGSRVKQGQTIGYIGSTGLATGPHLHYEFRVNGVHRNPLKVKLPSAKPLPKSEMQSFQNAIQPLVVQLDTYTENALVMRDL